MAELLPAEYGPALAARLLLAARRPLEAVYFCDHFNDARAGLLLRRVVDRQILGGGGGLFADHCHRLFVERAVARLQGLTPPEAEEGDGETDWLDSFVRALVQLDALFFDDNDSGYY
jgi:hypothetical protein